MNLIPEMKVTAVIWRGKALLKTRCASHHKCQLSGGILWGVRTQSEDVVQETWAAQNSEEPGNPGPPWAVPVA
jgi:hypothetical protein